MSVFIDIQECIYVFTNIVSFTYLQIKYVHTLFFGFTKSVHYAAAAAALVDDPLVFFF